MDNDVNKEIIKIEKLLDNADHLYHTFGESDLTDEQYDSYVDRLKLIDPKNKRFKDKKVGSKVDEKSAWKKITHGDYKMGSQSKVNDFDSLKKWSSQFNTNSYIVQEKLDGISIKLIYENGKLISSCTRGDGHQGEEILSNVYKMEIPRKIHTNQKLIIRGEILLFHSNLEFLDGKNARNTAAGTSKRLDGKGCEYLNIKVYDIMNWKDCGFKTNSDVIDFLKSNNFDVVNSSYVNSIEEVQSVMESYIIEKRDSLNWDIDGLVIKVNELQKDDWSHPNRSIAYKFPNQTKVTKLINVEWNDTGGRISPIGILEPVDIGGVTISKATLNNIDYIKKLNVKIGDTVLVSRRNDVIPAIENVVLTENNHTDIVPPTHDSEGFPIIREKNSEGKELIYLVSTNPNSRSKRIRRILNWFSPFEIKGLASATIESILDNNIAYDLPDFYDICLKGDTRLLNIPGFGKSTFKLLNQSILKTSKLSLIQFLVSLGFNGYSEKRFITILEHINKEINFEEFKEIVDDVNTIANIPGFGNNTALSLKNEFEKNQSIINEMLTRVTIDNWIPGEVNDNTNIAGLSFCFTGKMNHSRSELEKLVKSNGGVILGVSKKLDYLVTNDSNSGSSKNKKADTLGIKKISEEDFLNMI